VKQAKWAMILLMALPLGGCYLFEEQRDQAAFCELEAQRAFPTQRFARGNDVANYVQKCMTKAGYAWDENTRHRQCQGEFKKENNPYCYVPMNRIDRWTFDFNMAPEQL